MAGVTLQVVRDWVLRFNECPATTTMSAVLPHSPMLPKRSSVASSKCSRSTSRLKGRLAAQRSLSGWAERSSPSPLQLRPGA